MSINDIVQAGPELCRFCNNAVKSVKHFITECEDLIIVRNEVFESEIDRNVFNIRCFLLRVPWLRFCQTFVGWVYMSWFDLRILYCDVPGEDLLLLMFI